MSPTNVQLLQLVLAAAVTVIIPVVTKLHATASQKGTVSAFLVAVAGLFVELVSPGDFDVSSWLTRTVAVIGPAAFWVYRSFVRPGVKSQTGVVNALAVKTRNFGIGSSRPEAN